MRTDGRRVEIFLEAILRDRRPRRFEAGTEELDAMRIAAFLRSAKPGAAAPDPGFVDRLGRRLHHALREPAPATRLGPVSRRSLLAGAAAAAALAAGAFGEAAIAARLKPAAQSARLLADGAAWRPVLRVADVPVGAAVRFSTPGIEGFVVNQGGSYSALSAVCTHLGCTLHAGPASGTLNCPCHRTAFSLSGSVLRHQLADPPAPLPTIPARVRAGMIEVLAV